MAVTPFSSDTGTAILPDVGILSYNGVQFSCLYTSVVSGKAVKDDANWTVKYMEYTITVDGIVTLPTGADTTDAAWVKLRKQLDAQAGILQYTGKGFGSLIVNAAGGALRDVAWGPIPETLEFTPLGGSAAARIRWTVTTRIPEQRGTPPGALVLGSAALGPLLQLNYETTIQYDENAYSTLVFRGTIEIPLTRTTPAARAVARTVDAFRQAYLDLAVDLTRYRVVRRNFNYSRDQRTAQWEFVAEELPRMTLPPGAPTAHGTMSVRPLKQGPGLVKWIATLRGTYMIRKDFSPRLAVLAFVSLLNFRMAQSKNGVIPGGWTDVKPAPIARLPLVAELAGAAIPFGTSALLRYYSSLLKSSAARATAKADDMKCFLVHFGYDEGVYLDSKTITFEASWRFFTDLSGILVATGVWQDGIAAAAGRNLWATNVADIMGAKGNLLDQVNPKTLAIVDFGG